MPRPALSLVWIAAACASPPTVRPQPPREPALPSPERDFLIKALAPAEDRGSLRMLLRADFDRSELDRVGFDGISLTACIDDVVAAVLAARAAPEDPAAGAQLARAVDDYLVVRRDLLVRRRAGAASCIQPTLQ